MRNINRLQASCEVGFCHTRSSALLQHPHSSTCPLCPLTYWPGDRGAQSVSRCFVFITHTPRAGGDARMPGGDLPRTRVERGAGNTLFRLSDEGIFHRNLSDKHNRIHIIDPGAVRLSEATLCLTCRMGSFLIHKYFNYMASPISGRPES